MANRDDCIIGYGPFNPDHYCQYTCTLCSTSYNTKEEQGQCSWRCLNPATYQTVEKRSYGEKFLQDNNHQSPTENPAYQRNFDWTNDSLSGHRETPNSTASDYSHSPYAATNCYPDGSNSPAFYHLQAPTQGISQKYETINTSNVPIGSQESVFVNEVQGSSRVLAGAPSTVTPQNSQDSSTRTGNHQQGSQELTDSTYGSSPVSPSLSSNSDGEWKKDEQDHKSKRPTLKLSKIKKNEELIKVTSSKYPKIEEMARTHPLNQVEGAIRKKTNNFISKSVDGKKFFCTYATKCYETSYSTKQKAQDHIMSEHLSEHIQLNCKKCGDVIGKGRFYNARKHKCIRDPTKTDIFKCPCPVPGQDACKKFNNIYDLKKHLLERGYHYKSNLEKYKEERGMMTDQEFKQFFEEQILNYIREDFEKTNMTPVSTSKFASWPKLKDSLDKDWKKRQDNNAACKARLRRSKAKRSKATTVFE